MEGHTFARRALGAVPDTPDDVIFLVAVLVAFFSGALLIDWIRRVRDVAKQKQWHDTQMKALEKGFNSFEHLPGPFAAIQDSLNGLHGKADDASNRINHESNRIDEILQTLGHILKEPSLVQPPNTASSRDLGELLAAVRNIQDTLASPDRNTFTTAHQSNPVIPTGTINHVFSDISTLSSHPELPPILGTSSTQTQTEPLSTKPDPRVASLEVALSDFQSNYNALNGENMDLGQRLKAAEEMNAKIEENAREVAEKHWKQLLDDRNELIRTQEDNLQQSQGEVKDLSKQRDELAHANVELQEEIKRVGKSTENTTEKFEELRRALAGKDLSRKQLEEKLESQSSKVQNLETRLSLAENERTKTEEKIKDLSQRHGGVQLSLTERDATIRELNERLTAEANQMSMISTERNALAKSNESMNGQMRALEETISHDKRQIEHLTNERDIAKKQTEDLEQELEERNQARQDQKEDRNDHGDIQDSSSGGVPKQTLDFEQDPTRQTASPVQSITTPNEGPTQEPIQDPKAENNASLAMPENTPKDKDPEEHMSANEESEDVAEDTTSPANLPVSSSSWKGKEPVEKRNWAEDDAKDDLPDEEAEKSGAETALLPTTSSPGVPSFQKLPEFNDLFQGTTLPDEKNEHMMSPTVPGSQPNASPATPQATSDFVKDYCRNCQKDVILETFTKPDGRRLPDWLKHLKEVGCKPKDSAFQKEPRGTSLPTNPDTPNPGTPNSGTSNLGAPNPGTPNLGKPNLFPGFAKTGTPGSFSFNDPAAPNPFSSSNPTTPNTTSFNNPFLRSTVPARPNTSSGSTVPAKPKSFSFGKPARPNTSSGPPNPATSGTFTGSPIPARLNPLEHFSLDATHTHYIATQNKGHLNATCTLCENRIILPFSKSPDGRMNLDWRGHTAKECHSGANQGNLNRNNAPGNNRGGFDGPRGRPIARARGARGRGRGTPSSQG
jgi:predicted  nucleic acid-binding Zn-ribbon protein